MSSKSDKQRRARRIKEKFAKKIILRALQRENWDLQDVGNLVSLLLDQLHLDDASDVFKFVAFCEVNEPQVLVAISHKLSIDHIMRLLMCQGYQSFLIHVDDIFELDLIDINDRKIISALCDIITDNQITDEELIKFTSKICEHSRTKKVCGDIISLIISGMNMEVPEAVAFTHEVISHDFFLDLEGEFSSFLYCFRTSNGQQIKEQLTALLHSNGKLKQKKGSKRKQSSEEIMDKRDEIDDDLYLIDSDEDDEGNLKDFIVSDGEVEFNTSDEGDCDSHLASSDDEDEDEVIVIQKRKKKSSHHKNTRFLKKIPK